MEITVNLHEKKFETVVEKCQNWNTRSPFYLQVGKMSRAIFTFRRNIVKWCFRPFFISYSQENIYSGTKSRDLPLSVKKEKMFWKSLVYFSNLWQRERGCISKEGRGQKQNLATTLDPHSLRRSHYVVNEGWSFYAIQQNYIWPFNFSM